MQEMLLKLARLLDSVGEGVGRVVAWLTLPMVLVAFAVMTLRIAFDLEWIVLQESLTYMHAAVFMLGAAFALKQDGHPRVEIARRGFGDKARALVDLLGTLLLLFPVAIFIIWSSWGYVTDSWSAADSSRGAGGLPWVYWLKSLVPLMGGMLFLQGIAIILRKGLLLAGASAGLLQDQEQVQATEPADENTGDQGGAI